MATMQYIKSEWIKIKAGNVTIPLLRIIVDVGDGIATSDFRSSAYYDNIGKTVLVSMRSYRNATSEALQIFCASGNAVWGDNNGWKVTRNNFVSTNGYYYSEYPLEYQGIRLNLDGVVAGAYTASICHIGAISVITDIAGNIYQQIDGMLAVEWYDTSLSIAITDSGYLACTIPDNVNLIDDNTTIKINTTYIPDLNIKDISEIVSTDPYSPGGETESGGGTGDFDNTGDDIDFPSLPSLGATDTGFISLFNPTLQELKDLANYMWSSNFDVALYKKLFADPMECILGLSIVPVSVPDAGRGFISIGNMVTPIWMNRAGSQYIEVDCGSINVNEYWGCYLDYEPHTKAEIYLPYCGIHPISIDDIMGKTVAVKYHVDILSGACCAYVKCGNAVLYTFIGQCASSIPITGNDWTNVINGVLSAAVSVGTMVATGGLTAPMAVSSIASTAVNGIKPSIEKSGAMGGTGGMLAIQTPYLILTRPRQALPVSQNSFIGYPSFITSKLGSLSGYTEIENIHLHDVPATSDELTEIENLLKSGVIL